MNLENISIIEKATKERWSAKRLAQAYCDSGYFKDAAIEILSGFTAEAYRSLNNKSVALICNTIKVIAQ